MEKSKGHIMFTADGSHEFFLDGPDVYRAPVSNVFDASTGNRIGRWEGSVSHALRYAEVLGVSYAEMSKNINSALNNLYPDIGA